VGLEALTLDLNEQDLKSNGKSNLMSMQGESSQSIGLTLVGTQTSDQLTLPQSNQSMFSVGGSHAKTYHLQESEQALTESVQDCGLNTSEPFAHFDHDSCSWRTYQVSLLTLTLDEFSETWPRAGLMLNGTVYQQAPLAPLTDETEYGLLLTPIAMDSQIGISLRDGYVRKTPHSYGSVAEQLLCDHGLRINADFLTMLMGYPNKWTALEP
jgi:hypothetical protein